MGPRVKQLCVAHNNKTNDYKAVIKTGSKTKAPYTLIVPLATSEVQ